MSRSPVNDVFMRRFLLLTALGLLALSASSVAGAVSAPGVVSGRVMREAKTIQCVAAPCLEPVPGLKITFTRLGIQRVVKTNREGRYSITLAPGLYRVTGPGLVRNGLDAVRVRAAQHRVINLRVATVPAQPDETSTS
jgi:hypothetical protein